MTTYGVTDAGFILKRTADILIDLADEFDTRFPGIKTDGESVAGNIIGVVGAAVGQAWEELQLANNQYDPLSARGANLSTLVLLNGIVRKDNETDQALRERRNNVTFTPATAIVESIYSNLANIDNVTFARVYVNETGTTDARSITEHSVAVVIVGGDDNEIAETIFNNISAGIATFGTTQIDIVDVQGFQYPIRFTRPTGIPIYVDVQIDTDDNFPADGSDQIKQAIVDYAAGGNDSIGGTRGNLDGFPPGADVLRARLYDPINSVAGHNVTQLKIGKTLGTVAEADIVIDTFEVSTWSTDDITVTIVG